GGSAGAGRARRGRAARIVVSWALVLTAPAADLELLAAELFERGALGVELQEPGQPLMPGTPPLSPGAGRCIAHFADRDEAARSAADIGRTEAPIEIADEDWSIAWRRQHRPMRVGPRSWVRPPWDAPPDAARPGAALHGIPAGRIAWTLSGPDELPGPAYEIVAANILLNTLVDLAPRIARKVSPRGRLLLSGLLSEQARAAEEAYEV